jgi:tRNA pseudouridine13 synthase
MLPRASDHLAPCPGTARVRPEDTRLEERLLAPPSGVGHHWVLLKRLGISTAQTVAAVARAAECGPDAISHAGSRDRHAEVRQWFSVPAAVLDQPERLRRTGFRGGIQVMELRTCDRPMQASFVTHLALTLTLRGAAADNGLVKAQAILDHLRRQGVPNYLGAALLGKGGQQAKWGRMVMLGKRLPPAVPAGPGERGRYLQAYQFAAFNRYVAHRLATGTLSTCLDGEVVETGCNRPITERGITMVEDPAAMQTRIDSGEAEILGPLWGEGCEPAMGAVAALETELLTTWNWPVPRRCAGGRRAVRLRLTRSSVDASGRDVVLRAEIPGDAFASVIAEEFLHPGAHIP